MCKHNLALIRLTKFVINVLVGTEVLISEIDTAIKKKHTTERNSIDSNNEEDFEPPKPAKILMNSPADPEDLVKNTRTIENGPPARLLPKIDTETDEVDQEQSVSDYNKQIEDLNDKLFDKCDDLALSNSDENISEGTHLKVEDYEEDKVDPESLGYQKLEDSDEFMQESRSEESKEDQNRLEENSLNKDALVEDKKEKRNSQKSQNQPRNKHHKKRGNNAKNIEDKPVKLEEIKNSKYMKKRFESEPDEGFQSPNHAVNDMGDIYNTYDKHMGESSAKKSNKNLSYSSEAKSTRSEDKNTRNKVKCVHSTNPTSETSSFKDSSVASNQDNKVVNSATKMKKEKPALNSGNWVPTERKPKKPKFTKRHKPLKSDRPKYT